MRLLNIFRKQVPYLLLLGCLQVNAQQSFVDSAQNSLQLTGQLRPKMEIRDGAFRPLRTGEQPAALISERMRLTLDYTYKNVMSVRISPQTVGIWGQENMVQGAENGGNKLALFEAWSQFNLNKNWQVKIGRQVIALDDERFFGELDWAQGARAHDAFSVHYKQQKFEVKGFLSYNQNYKSNYGNNQSNPSENLYSTTDATPYKWMQTLWLGVPLGDQLNLSLLASNVGLQQALPSTHDTPVHYMQTFGLNISHTGKVSANVSAYYQMGKTLAGINTQAYLLALQAGYAFNKNWNAILGSDYVSGNDVGVINKTNNAFNPFFHTGHKFYGAMDYYFAGNGHKYTSLSDNFLRINFMLNKNFQVNGTIHQFYTTSQIKEAGKTFGQNLGQELDLSCSAKLNKFSSISGGYSFYLTTPSLIYIKNLPDAQPLQQWFWLSLNVTPTLFKTTF